MSQLRLSVGSMLSILICLVATSTGSAAKPNVLMIAVDDLRPMLGCFGDAHIQTPNIDRLAKRGVVFERAYCQYAKCGTSRLSLMTGLRPDSIGVFNNRTKDAIAFRKRRPDAISLAAWLKRHGYHTQSFGKIYHDGCDRVEDWSVPSTPGREREMWEIVDDSVPHKATIIADRLTCPVMQHPDVPDNHLFAGRMTEQVLRAMRKDRDQPSLFAVGFRRPHLPFVAPQRYFDMYRPGATWLAKNPQPPLAASILAWFNSDGYVGTARRIGLTMPNPPNHEQAIAWNGYELRSYLGIPNQGAIDRSQQLKILQAYAACVSFVDAQIGKLIDVLQTTGRLDNTVIILWSDHGWHLGEQSAWAKMTNYEIATRVPLIICAPGIKPGRTRTITELVDLYPTICELTGVDAPEHIEGERLTPQLRNPNSIIKRIALSQHARFGERYMGRAIRTHRFRYVLWTEEKTNRPVHRELYDHDSDPHETINAASRPQNSERVKKLEQQLKDAFRGRHNSAP